jgi:hypothetical protein
LGFKERRAPRVAFLRQGMLSAIELDDQLSVDAGEVDDMAPDRMLPPEFMRLKPPAAKRPPKQSFGIG